MIQKKKILILSIIVIMFVLISTLFAYSDSNFKPKYGITTANVNLRKQANIGSPIITTIPKNTNVKMVGTVGDFYIVQLKSNQVGLISKQYIKEEGTSLDGALMYQGITKYMATINSNSTNIRSGPGTNFSIYGKLNAGAKVEVIGKIDNFSMVITDNNLVGMIQSNLITKFGEGNNANTTPPLTPNDIQLVLNLINDARVANGLPKLTLDNSLSNVALLKAQDMVKNNYFSHDSPTYGSPFKMMQDMGIIYRTAGENIAGNPNLTNAVQSWLNSESHKQNILSNAYNYVGIGIEKSDTYGYILVAMFIGK